MYIIIELNQPTKVEEPVFSYDRAFMSNFEDNSEISSLEDIANFLNKKLGITFGTEAAAVTVVLGTITGIWHCRN